jgi:chromosome segregation ATPase
LCRYKSGYKLTGIIYLHRITDIRVGGASRRTFSMFRKLCGKDSLSNVLIVTNMWSDPPTPKEFEREAELQYHEDFFQPALAQGASLARRTHMNTESAHEIIRMLLGKEPAIMAVQAELIDQNMELSDTEAGRVLQAELREAAERHKAEMAQVKVEMETAMREQDEQTQKDLEEWQKEADAKEAKRMEEVESMKKGFGDEQAWWRQQIQEAQAKSEAAEARQRAAQMELEEARRREREADEVHRAELRNKIGDLERQIASKPGCIIS